MIPRKSQSEALDRVRITAGESLLLVGDTAMDIAVSLLLLIIVGRFYGPGGLGIYSFLLSVFVIVAFVLDLGIEKWVEREVASGNPGIGDRFFGEARAAILLSGLLGCLVTLIVSAVASGSSSVAGMASAGIWLIAIAVPLRLYSGFQISILHGYGKHAEAVWAGIAGRLVLLGSVAVMALFGLRPDLLTSCFVVSEAASVVSAGRHFRMPSLASTIRGISEVIHIIGKSTRYYFTHEGLRVLFFVDFFILGFFVTSSQEGSYAEASVLARLFLLIPLGVAPLYRVRIYRESEADYGRLFESSRLTAARMFAAHSVVGLFFLLYFPTVLTTVFLVQGDVPVFFRVFSLLLPGLLLFSSTVVLEPFFMTGGMQQELNVIALRVFIINALLNAYLIPYAGVLGAATATTMSLAAYFFWFMKQISCKGAIPIGAYLLSGGLVYVGYHFLSAVSLSPILVVPVTTVVLPVLFGGLGLFDQGEGKQDRYRGNGVTECRRKGTE